MSAFVQPPARFSRMNHENPELTDCQLHTAMAALVRSWWISEPKAVEKLLGEGGEQDQIRPAT